MGEAGHLLMHRRLDNVLSEPGGAVGPDGERRHVVREIASDLHLRQERGQAVGVDGIVGREEAAGAVGGVAPALVVRLVLALVLVAAVGELDEQRLRRAAQQFAVEDADDLVALFSRFHPAQSWKGNVHFFYYICLVTEPTSVKFLGY